MSGAVPELDELRRRGASELDLRLMVARIAEQVIDRGGGLVHGNHPTYTPIVESVAASFPGAERRVRIFATGWFYQDSEEEVAFRARHEPYAEVAIEAARNSLEASLTLMREAFTAACDALICIGGRGRTNERKIPGVGEEVKLMRDVQRRPVFLLGGFGGYTHELYREEFEKDPRRLGNALSDEENRRLADDGNLARVLALLTKGLERLA